MSRKGKKRAIVLTTIAAMLVSGFYFSPQSTVVVNAEPTYTEVDDAALDEVLADMKEVNKTRNSVHDPSVVVTNVGGVETYYVFGSHMGVSKTTDLLNWTNVTSESEDSSLFGKINDDGSISPVSYNSAFRNNAYTGKVNVLINGVSTEVDFGTYDASAWNTALDSYTVQGNMWAPDVIYNTTMNKWCMYLSLNGSKWNSSIILLTADNVEGPYVYQGPVIFSGFNGNNTDLLDVMDTDLDLIYSDLSTTGLPEKYAKGSSWGTYWPHAIDPCVSYDENGNLHLIYGSWSGGIYTIELDEKTGLRDYTVVYEDVNAGDPSVTSDAYFGKMLAGGDYVSGEGAYVEKIGNYWYLFLSYGFYSPDGGYEMRIFRSDSIDGSYTDASGNSAIYSSYEMNYGASGTTRGEKLMAGYKWDTMSIGEIAQGHNSAFTDSKGNSYVVYHTKFNDGSVGHELRVHQLYVNEDGWLVAAPYEYSGQTVNNNQLSAITYTPDDISGEYQVIIHKYGTNYANLETITPVNVTLNADGTISGTYAGTWNISEGSYINIVLDGVTYKGVLVEQIVDGASMETLCFTAAAQSGVNVWGSKVFGDKLAIALTRDALNLSNANKIFPIGNMIYQNVSLPTTGVQDAVVAWTSSNTAVISDDGVVSVPDTDTAVTMTCQIAKGSTLYKKSFDLTVVGKDGRTADTESGLVSLFTFEGDYKDTITNIEGTANAQTSGTLPSIKTDSDLNSQVVQLNFGYDAASSSNYVSFSNPLKGSTTGEATISLQVKRGDSDVWDAIWGFMDSDDTDGVFGRFYLTGNAYLGYNGTGGWFDANYPGSGNTDAIPVGEWSLVTITIDGDGFEIYVDGALEYNQDYTDSYGKADEFSDYSNVAKLIASADTFYLGYGSWWGTTAFRADDLAFYNRALNNAEVSALYDEFLLKLEGTPDEPDETARTLTELERYKTYYNDFESGLGDATVVGSGNVETVDDERFVNVYHNATGELGVRTNYLLLPSDTIVNAVKAGTNEMSIGFWVNVADATNYFYSPIFTAYGAEPDATTGNTWPMLALESRLLAQVNCAGWCDFTASQNVKGANQESTAWLDDKEWHYYTATFTNEQVTIYVDGVVMNQWVVDNSDGACVAGLFNSGSELDYVCLGGNQAWNWADNDASYQFDEIAVYSTVLNAKEIQKIISGAEDDSDEGESEEESGGESGGSGTGDSDSENEPRPIETLNSYKTYYNDFENGLGDATVVGSGEIETVEDERFVNVYHNATGELGVRTNYLLLPSDTIANAVKAGTNEMSIGFWVNVADATDYWFSPIFTAYGAEPDATAGNTWPMLALESRLLAQINCAGWCDFTASQNVAGANQETTIWLDDKEWHYYTATFTNNQVTVYVDGVLMNQWVVDNSEGACVSGLFSAGAELDYVCLGGNQAWNWADKDASYQFDEVAVYSTVLTAKEIRLIMADTEETEEEETDSDEDLPFIKGDDDKKGWDVIKEIIDNSEEGDSIVVDMNGTSIVPGDTILEIKGQNITLVFDIGNGISWSINGKSITVDSVSDIDFGVLVGTHNIPDDIVNTVAGNGDKLQISLSYDGEFGFEAVLSIGLGAERAGRIANLYYYNEASGKMEFICTDKIAQDGSAKLTFKHASDYVIAINTETANESSGNNNTENENSGNNISGSENSGNNNSENTIDEKYTQSTKTGDDSVMNAVIWFVVLLGIVVVIGGYVVVYKSRKSKI